MSDFVSGFWDLYVKAIVVLSILGCGIFLWMQSKGAPAVAAGSEAEKMDHIWDETLQEYNNPLPSWWRWLFYITIFFAFGYLYLYPGFGSYPGSLGWGSHESQYEGEMKKAAADYGPKFDKFLKMDLKAVAADKEAKEMGERLFQSNCAQCHGSSAKGSKGFPNLTDDDWLYGGDAEVIKTSIMNGRNGVMPAWGGNPDAVGGAEGAKEIANYVRSLSNLSSDSALAAKGKEKFTTVCAACHGADGKGNQAMGAPNLTDSVWLYGSSVDTIVETISKGRNNVMPAWKDRLGDAKVHLLAAYVYGLSPKKAEAKTEAAPAAPVEAAPAAAPAK